MPHSRPASLILNPIPHFVVSDFSSSSPSHSRSSSRSPMRQRPLAIYELDPLLGRLSPTSTLEALTANDAVATENGSKGQSALRNSIAAASETERALAIRSALTGKKLKEWYIELCQWPWPGIGNRKGNGFEPPYDPFRVETDANSDDVEPEVQNSCVVYLGSIAADLVDRYEDRIAEIREDMDSLDVEELKDHARESHHLPILRRSSDHIFSEIPQSSNDYVKMSDFTAVVTATILQALPVLAKLNSLLDLWFVRISVLRQVPDFMIGLEQARKALNSAWDTIALCEIPETPQLERKDFVAIRSILEDKVSSAGRRLDMMLDTLEGHPETLPDPWIDEMENIEENYSNWVMQADKIALSNEWGFSRIPDGELAPEDVEISTDLDKDQTSQPQKVTELAVSDVHESSSKPLDVQALDSAIAAVNLEREGNIKKSPTSPINTDNKNPRIGNRRAFDLSLSHPGSIDGTPISTETLSPLPAEALSRTDRDREDYYLRDLPPSAREEYETSPEAESSASSTFDSPESITHYPTGISSGENSFSDSIDNDVYQSDSDEDVDSPHEYTAHHLEQIREDESISDDSAEMADRESVPNHTINSKAPLKVIVDQIETQENSNLSTPREESSPESPSSRSISPPIHKINTLKPTISVQSDEEASPSVRQAKKKFQSNNKFRESDPYKTPEKAEMENTIASIRSKQRSSPWTLRMSKPKKVPHLEESPFGPAQTRSSPDPQVHTPRRMVAPAEKIDAKISSILDTIHAPIRLTSGPEPDAPEIRSPTKSSFTNTSRTPPSWTSRRNSTTTPTMTLAPAFERNSRKRNQSNDSDIKLYHLKQSGSHAAIKLLIRLVGEDGERVMVRVGGGWADLGEYLREYAIHHGRSALSEKKVEVQTLPTPEPTCSAASSPSYARSEGRRSSTCSSRPCSALDYRPSSSLSIRKTRVFMPSPDTPSRTEARETTRPWSSSGAYPAPLFSPSPSTELELPTSLASSRRASNSNSMTRPSIPFRSSSRLSWTTEASPPPSLGLAGPKSRNVELSREKQAWVDGMIGQARKVSAGLGGERKDVGSTISVTKKVHMKNGGMERC